jgi:hypothetical protein
MLQAMVSVAGADAMTESVTSPIDRRRRVGVVTIVCFVVAMIGLNTAGTDSAWPAAALRISIVLGALWLCLPTSQRPAAWSKLTRGRLAVIVLAAVFINRLKFFVPLLAVVAVFAWIIRPKKRR